MKRIFITSSLLIATLALKAQNPIITDQFTADPTARVFDGKMYLYPSHDIPSPIERLKEWFCMADYHVFSSHNLVDWIDHGVIVDQNQVDWVEPDSYSMWAPDCVKKDDKYYFYFPSNPKGVKGFGIGVAIGNKPEGPFIPEGEPIKGVNGIDPCVLVDKSGEAYIYWSGRGMQVAKLQDNMTELSGTPKMIEGLPEGFKEGPFVFERKGIYYFTFPWVQDKTETLAYAMGDHPMGPFNFKGLIMEQSPTECWTNHHSIVEYENQWYLFYHHNDLSPAFDKNRSVRIDSLSFNEDGTIQMVTPTLRGVGLSSARKPIQLDRYSALSDKGASIDYINQSNPFEGWKTILSQKASWVKYDRVDFSNKKTKTLVAKVLSHNGASIELRTGNRDGNVIANLEIPQSKDWVTISTPLKERCTGVNSIVAVLSSENACEIDWIYFK